MRSSPSAPASIGAYEARRNVNVNENQTVLRELGFLPSSGIDTQPDARSRAPAEEPPRPARVPRQLPERQFRRPTSRRERTVSARMRESEQLAADELMQAESRKRVRMVYLKSNNS